MLNLLRAESHWRVIGSGSGEEPFKRHKLTTAIQDASRRAGRDDIVIPRLVLPAVIARLNKTDRRMQRLVTTTEIDETVAAVHKERAADPGYAHRVSGILDEWRRRDSPGRERLPAPADPPVHAEACTERRPTEVPISSRKHETIWGKSVEDLREVGSPEAREVFQNIAASVSGITAIMLGRRSRGRLRNTCGATMKASSIPFVIGGAVVRQVRNGGNRTALPGARSVQRRGVANLARHQGTTSSDWTLGELATRKPGIHRRETTRMDRPDEMVPSAGGHENSQQI